MGRPVTVKMKFAGPYAGWLRIERRQANPFRLILPAQLFQDFVHQQLPLAVWIACVDDTGR
ncbi:hypothetical protein [Acidithiobacillus acidisediminis]|jgi:hypothetical protein|uniref:hypothetical protein n=1 Tax=Acidithiobacillus acidisediminis TaxID=2937799 RepID=UPI00200D1D8D|nr:hypothetical protein [Acidithiobacillus sp. S30A2]